MTPELQRVSLPCPVGPWYPLRVGRSFDSVLKQRAGLLGRVQERRLLIDPSDILYMMIPVPVRVLQDRETDTLTEKGFGLGHDPITNA